MLVDSNANDTVPSDQDFIYWVSRILPDGSAPSDGNNITLTHGYEDDKAAAYAPDGSAFAFQSDLATHGHGYDIYTADLVGDRRVRLTTNAHASHPSWLAARRPAAADLVVTQTSPDEVHVNRNLEYWITIRNDGPAKARQLVVVGTRPEAFSSFSVQLGGGPRYQSCDYDVVPWRCTAPTLLPGESMRLYESGLIAPMAPDRSTITNTVTAQSAVADPDATNSVSTAHTLVHGASHLWVFAQDTFPIVLGQPFWVLVAPVDDDGAAIDGFTGTVHFTSSDPAAVLPPDYPFSVEHDVVLNTPGPQTIAVREINTGLAGAVTVTPLPGVPPPEVSPRSVAFGLWPVGKPSTLERITLRDPGPGALRIQALGVSDTSTNPADFEVAPSSTCVQYTVLVGVGDTCYVDIRFRPGATGGRSAVYRFDTTQGSAQVALGGAGAAGPPAVSVSPSSVDFGSVPVGTRSPAQEVVFTNLGPTNLSVDNFGLVSKSPYEFLRSGGTCPGLSRKLAPGSSCTVLILFRPRVLGARSALYRFWTTAGTTDVSLSGTGSSPPIASAIPQSLDFGAIAIGQPSPAQTITLQNTGQGNLTIGSMGTTAGSVNRTDFYNSKGGTCTLSMVLAPGQSCTLTVRFTPGAVGPRSAVFRFSTDGGKADVALSGTGT